MKSRPPKWETAPKILIALGTLAILLFYWAAFSGNLREWTAFWSKRDDPTYLSNAIRERRYDHVVRYINAKRSLEFPEFAYRAERNYIRTYSMGEQPLLVAITSRRPDIAHLLLKNGANINIKDYDQSTPLHLAARGGLSQTCQELIEEGAELNARDPYGRTPLDWFVSPNSFGNIEVMKLLIDNGGLCENPIPDTTQKHFHLESRAETLSFALRWATEKSEFEAVQWLMEHGAKPDGKNDESKPSRGKVLQIGAVVP